MKLYEVPRNSKIKLETFDEAGQKLGDFITYYHPDGMFSYCAVVGNPSKIINLHLLTDIDKVEGEDYYQMPEQVNPKERYNLQ